MKITINIKQLGKKRPVIAKKTIEIEDLPKNPELKNLITNVVKQQVTQFNAKIENPEIISFLMQSEIEDEAKKGKVGFNEIYNDKKANEEKAIANALLSFEDGIYCVFIDDEQIENLNDKIMINKHSIITFVRLTFLSGSMW